MPMVIIAGHVEVDAAARDRFVAEHRDLVRRARRAPGCLDVAITADPVDPARVNNFERWASEEDLDAGGPSPTSNRSALARSCVPPAEPTVPLSRRSGRAGA